MWVPLAEHSCIVSFPNPPITDGLGMRLTKCVLLWETTGLFTITLQYSQLKYSHVNEVGVKPQIEAGRNTRCSIFKKFDSHYRSLWELPVLHLSTQSYVEATL